MFRGSRRHAPVRANSPHSSGLPTVSPHSAGCVADTAEAAMIHAARRVVAQGNTKGDQTAIASAVVRLFGDGLPPTHNVWPRPRAPSSAKRLPISCCAQGARSHTQACYTGYTPQRQLSPRAARRSHDVRFPGHRAKRGHERDAGVASPPQARSSHRCANCTSDAHACSTTKLWHPPAGVLCKIGNKRG